MKLPDDLIEQISSQVEDLLQQGQKATQDIRHNVRALVQSQLSKLDVVSREEFEIQQSILEKTRAQITQLETQLNELESKMKNESA